MGSEQLGYTPPEARDNDKKNDTENDNLTQRLVDVGLKNKGMERITKEQADELIAKLHQPDKPNNEDQEQS